MAPNSPTKASAARSLASASATSSRSTSASSTATSRGAPSARSAAAAAASKHHPGPPPSTALSRSAGAKDISTNSTQGTATDESYFSMSSSTTAASSRAPSRAGTANSNSNNVGNTTTASVRETRSRTRMALQNSTNRPLSRTGAGTTACTRTAAAGASTNSNNNAPSSPKKNQVVLPPTAPSMPASPSKAIGIGLGLGTGRVKAQAKALETGPFAPASSSGGGTLQHKSSTSTLRSNDGSHTGALSGAVPSSPSKMGGAGGGGLARPPGVERQESSSSVGKAARTAAKKLPASKISCFEIEDTEGIKAYLRIRPAPQEDKEYAEPYIQVLNETQVMMKPPREGAANSIRARVHATSLPTKYTFTRVFAPTIPPALSSPALSASSSTTTPKLGAGAGSVPLGMHNVNDQASFFQHTTLPLVRNLLAGESGLIFTYGVTNSGKSYTVLGGNRKNEAGILPRALDVVFNSIQGRQLEDARVRPRGLVGVEIVPASASASAAAASGGDAAADASRASSSAALTEEGELSSASAASAASSRSGSTTNNTTVKNAAAAAPSGRPFVVPATRRGGAGTTSGSRSASANTLGSTSTTLNANGSHAGAGGAGAVMMPQYDTEPTTVSIDRNYRYGVWVSYVEVYNEKLFDLLDAAVGEPGCAPGSGLDAHERGGGTAGHAKHGGAAASPGGGGNGGLAASFGITRSDSLRSSNWSIASGPTSGSSAASSERGSDGPSGAGAGGGYPHQHPHGHITLNRRPLQLKTDPDPAAGGKYVAGLSEHRVSSVQEAQALLQRGTENRVVFGTLANRMSSRSHGVFTIKVIREHAGTAAAAAAAAKKGACGGGGGGPAVEREFYTSRLSIVDLAGSERASNTGLMSGERLKEAGNINKSLMCLGQCLEVIRKNQARMASMIPAPIPASLSPNVEAGAGGNANGIPASPSMVAFPSIKRRLSVVPFRHSKLTELFQSFFSTPDPAQVSSTGSSMNGGGGGGGGRAVMIVNANPYDTGYDENSHVMKFSAVARDVQTVSRGGALPVAVYGGGGGGGPGGSAVPSSTSVPAFGSVGRHGFGYGGGVGVPPVIRFAPSAATTPRSTESGSATTTTTTTTTMAVSSSSERGSGAVSPCKRAGGAAAAVAAGSAVGRRNAAAGPGRAGSALGAVDPVEIGSDGPEVTIIEISDDEDDNDSDAFVDMLLEKHEELRQRLYECELEACLIEERIREEMTEQMEKRMREMERMYMDRLLNDAADSETFMNRKLDLLAGELDRERTQTAPDGRRTGSVRGGSSSSSSTSTKRAQQESNPVTPTQRRVRPALRADESTASADASAAEVEDTLLADNDDDEEGDEEEDEDEGEETTEYHDGEDEDEDSLGIIASRRVDEHGEEEGDDDDDDDDDDGAGEDDEDAQGRRGGGRRRGETLYLPK